VKMVPAGTLMANSRSSVDPSKSRDEVFELWSIPAYDRGKPDLVQGAEIGSQKQVVVPGDVLLSKIVPHIRRAWVVSPSRGGHRQIASSEWIVFRTAVADAAYLRHLLTSERFHAEFMSTVQGVGGSLLRARPSYVAKIQVPLPPIEEQRRIAAILDKADDLRTHRRAAVGMFVPLVESMLLDALASGRRACWPQVEVSTVAASTKNAIRTGPFGSQLLHSEFTDDGIPVLGIDNVVSNSFVWARPRHISEEKYQQLNRYTVHPGDVLITIMGTCGRVAVAPVDLPRSINTKHLCCITTDRDKCLPEYLRAALLFDPAVREQLGARERGAVMPGLNMQIIQQTRVTLPPLYVQEALAAGLMQADSLRADASRFARGLDEAFNSLAALAFSGGL